LFDAILVTSLQIIISQIDDFININARPRQIMKHVIVVSRISEGRDESVIFDDLFGR